MPKETQKFKGFSPGSFWQAARTGFCIRPPSRIQNACTKLLLYQGMASAMPKMGEKRTGL